ncbi:hypothetical protein niasHT_019188 [Heterodera trifolii]|uniref:Origin recognition complex subunit 1 n=1 Tax=Heterodera trifolii TaxID=157864 RepID=A0ABD2L0A2_9BILA
MTFKRMPFNFKKRGDNADDEDSSAGECSSTASSTPNSEYSVDEIIGHRVENGTDKWKVRWKGWAPKYDTWEPRENFSNSMHLLDKFDAKRLAGECKENEAVATHPMSNNNNQSDYVQKLRPHRSLCPPPSTSAAVPSVGRKRPKKKGSVKRTTAAKAPVSIPLLEAKAMLHTSRMPKDMSERAKECKEIRKFLLNCVKRTNASATAAAPRVLYISGVPGTGKTAAVLKVQKELSLEKKTPKFDFVNINALELSDPRQLFTKVYGKVQNNSTGTRKKMSARNAQQFLDEHFAEEQKKRTPIVILVDEVDMLYTKREDVLYTVFNWANMDHSRCSVVAISNTLDLAERFFSQRIASRMGNNRLSFQPYEFKEIEEIIRGRLTECPEGAFDPKAIELASKKIAAISGDLRKAFELIRRGIDIALEQCEAHGGAPEEQRLTVQHVYDSIHESQCSIRMEFLRALSFHERSLFRALVHVLYTSALDVTRFSALLPHYRQLCFGDAVQPLPMEAAFHHMCEMDSMHLILLDSNGSGELHRRVQLGFSVSEAKFCLRLLDDERAKEGQNGIEQ